MEGGLGNKAHTYRCSIDREIEMDGRKGKSERRRGKEGMNLKEKLKLVCSLVRPTAPVTTSFTSHLSVFCITRIVK